MNRQNTPKTAAASEAGYTFEPTYPDGTGIGATITVRGPDSEKVRALVRQQIAQASARELTAKKRGRDLEPLSLEEIEAQVVEMAVAYTVTWKGFEDGDKTLEPTEANFRLIYTEYPWIRRQVVDEGQDLGNFVRPPSAGSSNTPGRSSAST